MVSTLEPTYLEILEAESVHIIREVVAESDRPALLFSGGKDSIVLAHLAALAFAPGRPPFPALHVDTGHNFDEVIDFRDRFLPAHGFELRVASLPAMIAAGTVREPAAGASRNRLQTPALLAAVRDHRFDALLGGARRDEEKARAKERIFSFRDALGQWNPRAQRPEVWDLYNARTADDETVRVFPLSNWTERDVWAYIVDRGIELPSLYYAHRRRVFRRDGMRFAENPHVVLAAGEVPREETVRFRTVGDMTCTGAVASEAATPAEVLAELDADRTSERGATRADDRTSESAMEDRKREGYF